LFRETSFRPRAKLAAFAPPARAMIRSGSQGVGDLMQKSVANFLDRIEKSERSGKRNPPMRVFAAAKPPPRVIEFEAPTG